MSVTRTITIHRPDMLPPEPEPEKPVPVAERPTILTKARCLIVAMTHWKRAGMPMASKAVRKARLGPNGCGGCELWKPEGNFGFGECGAPGCGCSQFKAWLLTEKCPHPAGSRWPK